MIGIDKNIKKDISTNSGLIDTNTSDISSNLGLISKNEGNISSNLSKLNNIENNLILVDDIYNETFNISRFSVTFKDKRIFYSQLYSNFTTNGIIKINAKYNYVYDENYTSKHVYRFYNNKRQFKRIELQHDRSSKVINDKFEIQGIDSNRIDIAIYYENNTDSKKIELVGINTIQINYIENNFKLDINKNNISSNSGLISTNTSNISDNLGKIDTNTSNISDNLGKIDTNTSSISDNSGLISTNTSNIASNSGLISTNTSSIESNLEKINDLQNANIKAFYNLDQIFIYDINPNLNNKTVNKDNHFHIFEKEITYNFIKNSYLEIALKVLTEISNYVLIGFFQILCNFYDQDNNLFYTISLSTAMGSINKLSTIKSVFIVPINENMSKIKIDFFIAPKETQQNRSARFTIQDINSNKIYIKYFQKTDEMSIKDIQDSLSEIKSLKNFKYLKNIYFTDFDSTDKLKRRELLRFDNDSTNTVYGLYAIIHYKELEYDIKKNDFIEVDYKLILNHSTYEYAKDLALIYELFQEKDESTNTEHKILSKKVYYYNQFNEESHYKRISSYTKLFYKVKFDITKISLRVYIEAQPSLKKTHLLIHHDVVKNGANYISLKHYGN